MEPFHSPRGFTLVEMLVVLAIIVVITTVVLTSQSTFNKKLILKNTAYDIALSLRSTTSLGIGTRATSGGATNVGYGIHFTTGNSFTVFADSTGAPTCHTSPSGIPDAPDAIPGNCIYDGAASDILVQTYKLGNGITVSDYCAYYGNWHCTTSSTEAGVTNKDLAALGIAFARPNPNPFMSIMIGTTATYPTTPKITKACIKVTSPQGGESYVRITDSGGITVNQSSCTW